MTDDTFPFSEDARLRIRPLQVVELDDGVALSRGQVRIRLSGAGAYDAMEALLPLLQAPGMSYDELAATFPAVEHPRLRKLLSLLAGRNLLVDAAAAAPGSGMESAEDIFFWDFGLTADEVRGAFAEHRIHILGVNLLSTALASALPDCGFDQVAVVDVPTLRNLRAFGDPGSPEEARQLPAPALAEGAWRGMFEAGGRPSVLIATSDFGGKGLFRPWNELCVMHGVDFMPVVLQDMVGSIGPYVVPGETPCYECVRGRENSNMDDPLVQRTLESHAFEGQFACGYHPVLPGLVARIAAFELTKTLAGLGGGPIGRIVSFSALDSHMAVHKVLRLPHCPVCGTDVGHAGIALGDIDHAGT